MKPSCWLAAASVVATALATAGCGTGPAAPTATPTASSPAPTASSPAPVPVPTSGRWRTLPGAPIRVTTYHGVWTGTELLLHEPDWRSGRGSADAAYNPATGDWRRLPSSGYPVRSSEAGTQVVWTGTEMLTFGVMNGALDPTTGVWRPLAAPPLAAPSIVVWTGSEVLIWGGGCCDEASAAGAAYDPTTDTWRPLPAAPLAGRRTVGVWTGTELIVVGGQAHGEIFFADAAAYRPSTGTWRKLPPLPAARFNASVTWTGTEVLVVGGQPSYAAVPYADGLAYNPVTNRWRRLPSMDIGRSLPQAVWSGHQLIVWGGQARRAANAAYTTPPHGTVYDPVTDRWYPLPPAPVKGRVGAIAVWAGTSLLVWGGRAVEEPYQQFTDGASYRP